MNLRNGHLGRVDELPNHDPSCYDMNKGQKGLTELVIARGNTPELFDYIKRSNADVAGLLPFPEPGRDKFVIDDETTVQPSAAFTSPA